MVISDSRVTISAVPRVNSPPRDRKIPSAQVTGERFLYYFTCDHRKIIFPLMDIATRENKISMLTREIKKNILH